MIRVFVDAHVFDGEYQGTRTFLKGIYAILSTKNDISLFMGAFDVDNLKKEFSEAKNITYVKYNSGSGIKRLLFEIPSIIKRYKIDYAHFQYVVPPVKLCRYIVTTHDLLFYDFPKEFGFFYKLSRSLFFKYAAKKADFITTVSKYSKDSIQKHFKIRPEKIHLTPNGIEEVYFADFDKENVSKSIKNKFGFDKYILYVSRFEPRKNHILLVRSYLELELYKKGIFLILLGHNSIRVSELNNLLESLPEDVKRYIYINGNVNNDDLIQLYRAATLFVYPSKAEGFGIPPLEAGASKTQVICSNATAMSDFTFFKQGLFDPLNKEALKHLINSYLIHPLSHDSLIDIAKYIKETYTWEVSANKLYELFKVNGNT